MEPDPRVTVVVGLLLLLGNALFVAAEYGLVGSRRTRIESMAKHGNRAAARVLHALDDMSTYVAGIQVAITLFSISLGAVAEEPITARLITCLGFLPEGVVKALSIVLVAFPLVVLGELVPKYLCIRHAERAAIATITVMEGAVTVLRPLVWLTKWAGAVLLKPFHVDMEAAAGSGVTPEELGLLVRAGESEGQFKEPQADFLTRALKLDSLDAADIMVHRLDMGWLDVSSSLEQVQAKLKQIPHSRIPLCRGDIDEVVGVVYLQDIIGEVGKEPFSLEAVMRPAEFVPENLPLDRVIARMREAKTQILIVRDEYGGTSGLLTLEDVVEEVFGELEDRLESERPPIERVSQLRVVARADVRYDELLHFLKVEHVDEAHTTETLATLITEGLERVPRLGDAVELPIGRLRVDNMARRRITRVSITLNEAHRGTDGA